MHSMNNGCIDKPITHDTLWRHAGVQPYVDYAMDTLEGTYMEGNVPQQTRNKLTRQAYIVYHE